VNVKKPMSSKMKNALSQAAGLLRDYDCDGSHAVEVAADVLDRKRGSNARWRKLAPADHESVFELVRAVCPGKVSAAVVIRYLGRTTPNVV
jgi:hypothetical protein